MASLDSDAEARADAATSLRAFNKLNLGGVKDEVEQVLRLIGTDGLFREYTLHDISHINKMLGMLDELIPGSTKEVMSAADWLLTVLGIYFHDMGLLVTKSEFDAREQSGFRQFCEDRLFSGTEGAEYRSKVESLGDDADTFLYQEFVRSNHALRIGDWIRGRADSHRGVSKEAAAGIAEVLAPLPDIVRDDLAKICESHHLNDLDDTDKYQVRQPYGDSDAETANVQYIAVLLRTTDLLHITKDRTPSTAFRFINPQNPTSQREWAKQMAVRRIRPQLGKDADGNFNEDAPQDTLEVFADFDNADGFFGLMAYLRYAREQVAQSHAWIRTSQQSLSVHHEFPWRFIDDSQVTAKGFLPQHLSFTLDQGRILELLTGHTLYNDTTVVVRELVQNAIDAVRLQSLVSQRRPGEGVVQVEWSSATRELIVRDNGTGMSQQVIENNLLKAGASRYQEESFINRHRDFSPISKFGIGVLSAFMIADSVEIVTCSPEDEQARRLTLRSVHDRYLVSLLDKTADETASRLAPHGTEVKLHVRDTARLPSVERTVRHWVVVPRCTVTVAVDGGDAEPVGHGSCQEAVESTLRDMGLDLYEGAGDPTNTSIRVMATQNGNVETAFAVGWNAFFREWSFLRPDRFEPAWRDACGACIEGIRVEDAPAGYRNPNMIALANAVGHGAPKTNVARSGLEATPERAAMLRGVYDTYVGHVASELADLVSSRGFSTTWAAQEAELLLHPLLSGDAYRGQEVEAVEPQTLEDAVAAVPLMIVEDNAGRRLAAGSDLQSEDCIWTVDSAFVRAGESLLREIPTDASLAALATGLETEAVSLPAGITLVGYSPFSHLYRTALAHREARMFRIAHGQRRVDVAWERVGEQPAWMPIGQPVAPVRRGPRVATSVPLVAITNPEVEGRRDEVGVKAHGTLFIFADNPIAEYVRAVVPTIPRTANGFGATNFLAASISRYLAYWRKPDDVREWLLSIVRSDREPQQDLTSLDTALNLDQLVHALESTPIRIFDPSAWRREDDRPLEF